MAKAVSKEEKMIRRLTPGTYKLSDAFFSMPRCYVDGYYPQGTFTLSELRRIIHLCYTRHADYGTTWSGHKDFVKLFGNIKPDDFKRIEQNLISRGFISHDKAWGTVTQYAIMVPPMYSKKDDDLVALYPNRVFNSNAIENFIKLPVDIVEEGVLSKRYALGELDYNEVMLLLKLYRHNELSVFGGVDYNLFNCLSGQKVFISNSLLMDISLTDAEFNIAFVGLFKRGLISLVDVDVDSFVLDKSMELLCFASDLALNLGTAGSKQVLILRPYYQPPFSDKDNKTKRK